MTTKTTLSTRPTENSERATLVKFTDAIDAKSLPDGCSLMLAQFRTANSAYAAARTANEGAAAAADVCSTSVGTATPLFKVAFDTWTASIDEANQKKGFAEKVLPQHLGGRTFSKFLKSDDRFQVDTMAALFDYVATNPVLAGKPDKLLALKGATTAFDTAVTASEAALRTRATAVVAFAAATAEFDRRWGRLVDELRLGAPALAAQIPTFRRVSGTEDPVPPTEPTEPPTEPTEPPAEPIDPPTDPPVTT